MITTTRATALLLTLALLTACGDDGDSSGNTNNNATSNATTADAGGDADAAAADSGGDAAEDAAEEDTAPTPCTDTRRPFVAAHGFLASGDTYASHAMRFEANGYCLGRIFAFDWNTLDQDGEPELLLDQFIDDVLAETGAAEVDLAGHSAGGGLGYRYLADPARASKVAHYIHIGSSVFDGPAGPEGDPVPTLNLWSEADLIIDGKGDIPGATNVRLTEEDHYAVATSAASFTAIYRFIHDDQAPATTDIAPDGPIVVSGRALSLGENAPVAGGAVAIYAVDPDTGGRLGDAVATFTTDDLGHWGPFTAEPDTRYEFRVQGAEPDSVPVHYYREPFVRSNPLVYLRTLPGPDSFAGQLLSVIPFDDEAAIVIIFLTNRGLNAATDSLTVNGLEVATDAIASPDQTTIALFLYDDNRNGASDEAPVGLFSSFPFLNAFDLFFPADPDTTITVDLNGSALNLPSWPSASEGATIAVFE